MRSTMKWSLIALAFALSPACSSRHGSGATDADDVGQHASMAVDATGTVHASFYWRSHKKTATHDVKVGGLMYATGKVGADGFVAWSGRELVDGDSRLDGGSDVGLYTSLALAKDGTPRISYYDVTHGDLKFASKLGGKWVLEQVDTAGNVGGYTSLVLENDKPRIAYYDFDAHVLKFAKKDGAWTTSVIDDGNAGAWDVGKWCSLASDGNGGLGVAYYDATNGDLGYRVGNSTAFGAAEWVDVDGDTGRWPRLAYDLGAARIAYQDYSNQHLKFAKKDSAAGTWALETVDSNPWTGADTSIAIDPTGKVTVAYFDGLNNDALSAKWDGSHWTLAKVAADGANGYFNNVVLDPASKAPIFGWYTFTGTNFVAMKP